MSKGQKLERMMNLSDRISAQLNIALAKMRVSEYSDKAAYSKANRLYRLNMRVNRLMADSLSN